MSKSKRLRRAEEKTCQSRQIIQKEIKKDRPLKTIKILNILKDSPHFVDCLAEDEIDRRQFNLSLLSLLSTLIPQKTLAVIGYRLESTRMKLKFSIHSDSKYSNGQAFPVSFYNFFIDLSAVGN